MKNSNEVDHLLTVISSGSCAWCSWVLAGCIIKHASDVLSTVSDGSSTAGLLLHTFLRQSAVSGHPLYKINDVFNE